MKLIFGPVNFCVRGRRRIRHFRFPILTLLMMEMYTTEYTRPKLEL